MGREALCGVRVGEETAESKVLLESSELILRGAIKRRYKIAELTQVEALAEGLSFHAQGEAVTLFLGEKQGQSWASKLVAQPPTLAEKLGVGPQLRAYVMGVTDDAALENALCGACTDDADAAQILVSIVRNEADLAATIDRHAGMPCAAIWVIYAKGRALPLGETVIRSSLRNIGYVDNKTAAVSNALTATRFVKRPQ